MHDFEKVLKESYAAKNVDFNQLDFPINKMFVMAEQYQIAEKFEGKNDYKRMKMRFHAVLGKREEEIWSLVKIVRVLNISKDILFEGILQNYHYHAVWANNVAFDFSVAYFPLMNFCDLISVA